MWIKWFIRCSTSIRRWSLKFVYDECKRRRYILSFSPLLFINNQNINNKISVNDYDNRNENYYENYYKKKSQNQSTINISSVISALTSAGMIFSWINNGISDKEL